MTLAAQIEAVLFASGEVMAKKQLATLLGVSLETLEAGFAELESMLSGHGLALVLTEHDADLRTAPEAADILKKLREGELSRDLGRAGLEVLAIILYRGGATRTEVDWIRGVNSSGTVRALQLRGLIEKMDDPADKRRFRYIATTDALAHLGLKNASELPRHAELKLQTDAAALEAARADVN